MEPKRIHIFRRRRSQQKIEGNNWKTGKNLRGKSMNGPLWNLKQKKNNNNNKNEYFILERYGKRR